MGARIRIFWIRANYRTECTLELLCWGADVELEWKRNRAISVKNAAELDAALEAIERDPLRTEPVLVFLAGPRGFLSIGLGDKELSVLMYGTHDRQPPLHAVGDEAARAAGDDRPLLTFSSYGRPVQFAKWCGLSKETARLAARSFLQQDGALWSYVRWEEEAQPA